MTRKALIIFLLAWTLAVTRVWGATYLIGSDASDDYASYALFRAAATEAAGDTVSFRKGEQFREIIVCPDSGASGNEITYTSHGTGARPIIDASLWFNDGAGGNMAVGADPATTWVDQGGGIYMTRAAVGAQGSYAYGACKMVLEDGVLIKLGSAKDALNAGEWFHVWEAPNYNMYYRPTSGSPADHKVERGYYANAVWVKTKSYITFDGLAFRGSNFDQHDDPTMGAQGGLGLETSPYITVSDCVAYHNAQCGIMINDSDYVTINESIARNNTCNGIKANNGAAYGTITNCDISENAAVDTNSFQTDKGGLLLGGSVQNNNWTITDTDIHDNGYSGITADGALYVQGKDFDIQRLRIFDNYLDPVEMWGTAAVGAIGGTFANNLIRDNTCNGGSVVIIRTIDELDFVCNTFSQNTPANGKAMFYIYCNDAAGDIKSLILKNNICHKNQSAGNTVYQIAFDLENRSPDTTGTDIDNNDFCITENTSTAFKYIGNTYTLAQIQSGWNAATGYDDNSITSDPRFPDSDGDSVLDHWPMNPDLWSAGTSISGITADYYGITRRTSNPTIGAVEMYKVRLDLRRGED